jgi:hypothetical protein
MSEMEVDPSVSTAVRAGATASVIDGAALQQHSASAAGAAADGSEHAANSATTAHTNMPQIERLIRINREFYVPPSAAYSRALKGLKRDLNSCFFL